MCLGEKPFWRNLQKFSPFKWISCLSHHNKVQPLKSHCALFSLAEFLLLVWIHIKIWVKNSFFLHLRCSGAKCSDDALAQRHLSPSVACPAESGALAALFWEQPLLRPLAWHSQGRVPPAAYQPESLQTICFSQRCWVVISARFTPREVCANTFSHGG